MSVKKIAIWCIDHWDFMLFLFAAVGIAITWLNKMEVIPYALAGLSFVVGLVLSKYITEMCRRWSDKMKGPPPQSSCMSKISFEFPILQILRIDEHLYRIDMYVVCGNASDKSVNVGIMKLNIGKHQHNHIFKDPLTLNCNNGAIQPLTTQGMNGHIGDTKIWTCNITFDQANAILSCIDPRIGSVYVEVRIHCMDDGKYWPDNSKSVNPDEGWKGAVKMVDHSLQIETIARLATGIESLAEDIDKLPTPAGTDMQLFGRLCGTSHALRSACERIPGITKTQSPQ